MKRLLTYGLLAVVVPLVQAETFGFACITNNDPVSCGTAPQYTVDVTDAGFNGTNNQVAFTFKNAGPLASSITDVYFDDGTLLGMALPIVNSAGVSFSQMASPGNLPGGNSLTPPFQASSPLFTADSNAPNVPSNGVNNPAEQLTIIFNLISGQSFQDTLNALALAGATGGLRIGIHVQAFANDESESFVNVVPVPEPTAIVLLGAMASVYLVRRKRLA